MTQVSVARLRLRAAPDRAGLVTHRVTDALRVAPAPAERLLVIRTLSLGRLPAGSAPGRWHDRTSQRLAEQIGRAVHGGHPAAANAGCVWFRSATEARALLLRELAAGRRPAAWFWRLAVPDWEDLPLDAWLPRWMALAAREAREEAALARAVMTIAEAGDLPRLLAAVSPALIPLRFVQPSMAALTVRPRLASPSPFAAEAAVATQTAARTRALTALAQLDSAARRALLTAILVQPETSIVSRWLARAALVAVTPELAGGGEVVAVTVEALVAEAWARKASEASSPTAPANEPPASSTPIPASADSLRRAPIAPAAATPEPPADPETPAPTAVQPEAPGTPAPRLDFEQSSRLAGLFLLVRPLIHMDFDRWLEARPETAADGFARALLRTIAVRMGAAEEDLALKVLAGDDRPDWAADLTAWRVGLDRWLRRTARIRLADVVRRPGGLLLAEDMLEVRYPPASADIRLRRRALDLDPGWTPWLGLSIRYHYRDEPLR